MIQGWWRELTRERPTAGRGISPGPLLALMALIVCLICSVFTFTLYASYADVRREAESSTKNIANALSQDIGRTLQMLDISLQAAVDGWKQPEIWTLRPELQGMILFDRAASNLESGSIVIIDNHGDVVMDAQSRTPRKGNFTGRDFFAAHRDNPGLGLFVSAPYVSPLTGEWAIDLSRRLTNADGGFGGVATASIKLEHFRKLFSRIDVGIKGRITLLSTNGTVVMRHPLEEASIGSRVPDGPLLRAAQSNTDKPYRAKSTFDGEERLYAFRKVGDYPLIQSIGLSWTETFETWWTRSVTLISALCVLCLGIATLTTVFASELRRRIDAEKKLDFMARTDILTQLGNRRRFDEALAYEWARAISERKTVALLVIDADHFKAFNDTHGHVGGDKVLAVIGRCIGAKLRLPADVGARYGGEEFAVILPNTNLKTATRIAEDIRQAIFALAIDHRRSSHQYVTVSIGVAAASIATAETGTDLVRRADAALYAAKKAGRNQVSAHADPAVSEAA